MPKAPAAPKRPVTSAKTAALEANRSRPEGTTLTTDTGVPIPNTDDSLRAGIRGPSLLEDFHLREKITRFDHERIPERVVHARGAAAHGYFQVYEPLGDLTRAQFLNDPSAKTPVFVRFSTVGGSRGSADTVRDVRGFATKFYTGEGNFDLVGNNMPVFFIQDGIKFPDFVHAVKPEPHHEMPQASSAHDSFWDFVSLVPESAHMVMWLMSDRALPRSYRMMDGFGVHTFRLVNGRGKSRLVKFHWKPLLGAHSLAWEEAQQLAGKDPDFNRRDLWETLDQGGRAEWELGLQIMREEDVQKFGFDLLDPTKLVPEELVPVRRVGKMTLDRNPDNYFAETEQVAFCVSNLVPGIDVTDDPLMQARLFSYLDTQLTRLGGPNHAELPINRPLAPVHNHQQDGFGRHAIPTERANYHPNSVGGGCPFLAGKEGYTHFPEPLQGNKIRARSESFGDHFSQAAMFVASQSPAEKAHLTKACEFELGKVERPEIRERVVNEILARIDADLAADVARGLGLRLPKKQTIKASKPSPALSLETPRPEIRKPLATRKIAVLAAEGAALTDVMRVTALLKTAGALVEVVAPRLGELQGQGETVAIDRSLHSTPSLVFDALIIAGGKKSVAALSANAEALLFVGDAYRHCKPIGALGEGLQLLQAVAAKVDPHGALGEDAGLVLESQKASTFGKRFSDALAQHRFWSRMEA